MPDYDLNFHKLILASAGADYGVSKNNPGCRIGDWTVTLSRSEASGSPSRETFAAAQGDSGEAGFKIRLIV